MKLFLNEVKWEPWNLFLDECVIDHRETNLRITLLSSRIRRQIDLVERPISEQITDLMKTVYVVKFRSPK